MARHEFEYCGLPKEVVICRFGSAYSTLTVVLLDKKAHDSIQCTLNELGATNKLQRAVLTPNERVCFNHDGYWMRARVKNVHDDRPGEDTRVDIELEDTNEVLRRVSAEALVAMPEAALPQRKAFPFFIEGLEPYRFVIAHRYTTNAVTAQDCADTLNDMWVSKSRVAILRKVIAPNTTMRAAIRSRVFVASLSTQGDSDIRSCIESSLSDYVLEPLHDRYAYLDSVRHADVVVNNGTSILVPHLLEEEICEVLSLRKNRDRKLQVGLRLQRYLDQDQILERLLGDRLRRPGHEAVVALSAVCIYSGGICQQRGVVLESGKVLGIDTLDIFDVKQDGIEIREMTRSLGDALPHLGLFIDWDTSMTAQTPSLGDYVLVTNLRPMSGPEKFLHHSYDNVTIMNEPTVLRRRGCRESKEKLSMAETQSTTTAALRRQPKKKPHNKRKDNCRGSLVEWYGMNTQLAHIFSRAFEYRPGKPWKTETLLREFGESVPLGEL